MKDEPPANKTDSAIFIIPRPSTAWRGNEAGWITASGWAAAGQQLWGEALVVTSDGIFTPQESMLFPRGVSNYVTTPALNKSIRQYIPEFIITGYKDLQLKRSKPKVWPIEKPGILDFKRVKLVWERHDLFSGPGRRLANKLGVPFVISVEAPAVWEAEKWGVKRPVWGRWLEKYFEAKSLKGADLVCCVSDEVRNKVIEMGVSPAKAIVSHNRVDSSVFHPMIDGVEIQKKFNLAGKKVVGWTGSFRSFHGLDSMLLAFKSVHEKHKETILMLVGDGMELETIRRQAQEFKIADAVIFAGRQPFINIPHFIANFDVALVGANSDEGFHYSPLKLREYLALGKAVIAPRAGNLPALFKDGVELLLYRPGDSDDLSKKINMLLEDSLLHSKLKSKALELFEEEGTWVHELTRVCTLLNIKI